jgi:hypothetical protein
MGLPSVDFARLHGQTVDQSIMKSQGPPLVSLFLRAMLWAPVAYFLMAVWLVTICAMLGLPLIGILQIWDGDYLSGVGSLGVGLLAFFLARWMKGKIWEEPPSLI